MNTGRSNVMIKQVVNVLPAGFDELRAEASAEGYRFLDRLAADWASGTMQFDRPGEAFLAAYSGDVLAGVGGITLDPVTPKALRMRRFYVRPMFRHSSFGRTMATMLLERAQRSANLVTLNAAPNSFRFWESLGFVFDPGTRRTHIRQQLDQLSSFCDQDNPAGYEGDT